MLKLSMKISSVRNTIILSIVVFCAMSLLDKDNGILYTNNFIGSLSYTFGYAFGLPLIISLPFGLLAKLRKKSFVETFCSTFFFMLIVMSFVFYWSNFVA